jgi:bifunctional non-homologous end joining protein LigD
MPLPPACQTNVLLWPVYNAGMPIDLAVLRGVRASAFPGKLSPMQPTLISKPFSDPEWIFEPKLDGFRGIAYLRNGVRIISLRGYDLTASFKDIAEDLRVLEHEAILDGELVAVAPSGRPCFECLQQHIGMRTEGPKRKLKPYLVMYYVFDILYLDGWDLTGVDLLSRKKALADLNPATRSVRAVEFFEGEGNIVFSKAVEAGFEGVVAKKKDSIYEAGERSRKWLKAKSTLTQQFVIGGYVVSSRTGAVGSLLVGSIEDGKLEYKGNVGTGISKSEREELGLEFDRIRVDRSPFGEELRVDGIQLWVKPQIFVEVRFTRWTESGYMREPVFVRILP